MARDFEFDNTQYINLGTGVYAGLVGASAVSFSMIAKPESLYTGTSRDLIVVWGPSDGPLYYVAQTKTTNLFALGPRSAAADTITLATTNTAIYAGIEYQFAGYVDLANGKARLYVNGTAD